MTTRRVRVTRVDGVTQTYHSGSADRSVVRISPVGPGNEAPVTVATVNERVSAARAAINKPMPYTPPVEGEPGCTPDGRTVWFHGTSQQAAEALMRGQTGSKDDVVPTFRSSNVSLGGVYLTCRDYMAEHYARLAARANGEPGSGVVLVVAVPEDDLQPDEDWVVNASQRPEPGDDEDADAQVPDAETEARLDGFMSDLFNGYSDGLSLSDHYKQRYERLTAAYAISWRDSLTWCGSVRVPSTRTVTVIDTLPPSN